MGTFVHNEPLSPDWVLSRLLSSPLSPQWEKDGEFLPSLPPTGPQTLSWL